MTDNSQSAVLNRNEVIEMDTAENEDIENIWEFLFPMGIPDSQQVSINFNKGLLNGWVKQPSPCCAAAAVAGAWNCLSNVKRHDCNAMNHKNVLNIYISMFEESIRKKKESFERKLGGSAELLFEILFAELNNRGYYLKVQKPKTVKKETLKKLLLFLCCNYHKDHVAIKATDVGNLEDLNNANNTNEDLAGNPLDVTNSVPGPVHPLECIYQLFSQDTIATFMASISDIPAVTDECCDSNGKGNDSVVKGEQNDDVEDDEKEEEEEEELIDVVPVNTKKTKFKKMIKAEGDSSSSSVGNKWNTWLSEAMAIIKTISGLHRLTYVDRPSTTAIGNWGLLQGVPLLSEYCGLGTQVQIRLFMGSKSVSSKNKNLNIQYDYVTLCRRDTSGPDDTPASPEEEFTIQKQWDALRSEFMKDRTVLLFHLKNHYALVYAVREWSSPLDTIGTDIVASGNSPETNNCPPTHSRKRVRQILTARRGQRPTVWMDFEEVRQVLLSWDGYKMMSITSRCSAQEMISGKAQLEKWESDTEEYRNLLSTIPLVAGESIKTIT